MTLPAQPNQPARRRAANFVLLALLAFSVVPVRLPAADPPGGQRTDSNGDPLPERTVARFGSGRLLHGGVDHLEFSPDGKRLASSGADGARLWDVATGKEVLVAHLPRTGRTVLTFTPDGAHVVGDARSCRVIDPATGQVRCFWRNPGKQPSAIVVAADGKSAVTAWAEGGVTVCDLAGPGRRTSRTLSGDHADLPMLSGDGRLLAYASNKEVALWDVRAGVRLHTHRVEGEGAHVSSLALSRDGRRLAAGLLAKFYLWDTATHAEVEGLAGPIYRWWAFLRFSADDTELVGISSGLSVGRWSASTGKEKAPLTPPLGGREPYRVPTLSPDGRTRAAWKDGFIRLWDQTGKELVPVEGWPAWGAAQFVTPEVVAVYTRGREKGKVTEEVLAFWDVTTGRLLHQHAIIVPKSGWWRRALSPDGKVFAAGDDDKHVVLFDVNSGREMRRLTVRCRTDEQAKFAFGPDGRVIITSDEGGLRMWDVATGKALRAIEGVSDGAMAFSPDGRTVASAFVGRLVLTEVASGKARWSRRLPESEDRARSESCVTEIRFARNGGTVAAVARCDINVFTTDRAATVLDLFLGTRTNIWDETGDLSPSGRWLAHANNLHPVVSVRDLHRPGPVREFQTLAGHAGEVGALAFSPDGKYLVSCGADGTALVWDTKLLTGRPGPTVPEAEGADPEWAEERWNLLADADPARAAQAFADLVGARDAAVALLKERLKPAEAAAPGRAERLIADLDSDVPPVRQKAFRELGRLAEQAAPALRKGLEGKPSREAAPRVKQLLADLEGPLTDPERLRQVRAVELLERIGTPAAREVLEALARGAPDARLTQEAKASLARWRR